MYILVVFSKITNEISISDHESTPVVSLRDFGPNSLYMMQYIRMNIVHVKCLLPIIEKLGKSNVIIAGFYLTNCAGFLKYRHSGVSSLVAYLFLIFLIAIN